MIEFNFPKRIIKPFLFFLYFLQSALVALAVSFRTQVGYNGVTLVVILEPAVLAVPSEEGLLAFKHPVL
jgi:hypothetical protein